MRKPIRNLGVAVLACVLSLLACVGCAPARGTAPTEADAKALAKLVSDVDAVHQLLMANRPPNKKKSAGDLTPQQRQDLMSLWGPHIDHELALLSYEERFLNGWRDAGDGDDQTRALSLGVAALAARISSDLDFLEIGVRSEVAEAAMDDSVPEYGLQSGNYRRMLVETAKPQTQLKLALGLERLKQRMAEFRALNRPVDKMFVQMSDKGIAYAQDVEKRYASVAPRLMANAMGQVASDQLAVVSGALITNIALWLGDTRLRASDASLISSEQVDWLATQAKPGDVIVERRNWYLSNLGLPGFWPHAEFYLGTPDDLAAAFDQDPSVQAEFGAAGLTGWLKVNAAELWGKYMATAADGRPHRIMEAISEGVQFSSLHEGAKADYVGVLRPRLSTLDKARAIAKGFAQLGKPYDFDFDFETLDLLVCSEVVYQAYLPEPPKQVGLSLPLTTVMGRKTLPPNDLIRLFDQQYGTASQQFDFVAFLDGRESTGAAEIGTVETLRASWKRPKWDISQL